VLVLSGSSSTFGASLVMLGGVYFLLLVEELLFLEFGAEGLFFIAGGDFAEPEFMRLVGGMAGVVERGTGAV